MRARTKPVEPIYYDILLGKEKTSIKRDGTDEILIVDTEEWFKDHEILKDGEEPKAAKPTEPRKKQKRATKAEMAERAAAKAAKGTNGHQTPPAEPQGEDADPSRAPAYGATDENSEPVVREGDVDEGTDPSFTRGPLALT